VKGSASKSWQVNSKGKTEEINLTALSGAVQQLLGKPHLEKTPPCFFDAPHICDTYNNHSQGKYGWMGRCHVAMIGVRCCDGQFSSCASKVDGPSCKRCERGLRDEDYRRAPRSAVSAVNKR